VFKLDLMLAPAPV